MSDDAATAESAELPTAGELSTLPQYAKIAYAVRAARRVQPLFVTFWPDAPLNYPLVIEQIISDTEAVAGSRRGWASGKPADAAADAAYHLTPDTAAYVARAAARAADAGSGSIQCYGAGYAASIACPDSSVASVCRRDFELLRQFSAQGKWTHNTPVPVEILGPLWPGGAPDWYAEAIKRHNEVVKAGAPKSGATKPREARPEAQPDFVERAERVLSGDIGPGDYLSVVPEVAAGVESELRRLRDQERIDASGEFRTRLVNEWTLQYYYGGQTVACQRTERGVIVFAVGSANIRRLFDHLPRPDQRPGVVITTPALWQPPSPTDSNSR